MVLRCESRIQSMELPCILWTLFRYYFNWALFLVPLVILAVAMLCPDIWHYKYLGKIVSCSEGAYYITDERKHDVEKYTRRIDYIGDDGIRHTIYENESGPAETKFALIKMKENGFIYAYDYIWERSSMVWFVLTVAGFLVGMSINDAYYKKYGYGYLRDAKDRFAQLVDRRKKSDDADNIRREMEENVKVYNEYKKPII